MIKFFVILFYSFFAFTTFGQTERRFLIWNKNEVIIQPWKNISFNVAENIHYSPKLNALNQKYAEFNLLHQPEKWFEYGAGFRVVKANTYPGWIQENRTILNFQTVLNTDLLKMIFNISDTARNLKLISLH